ncbi:hypothetical protein [Leptotrichia trevisanii]
MKKLILGLCLVFGMIAFSAPGFVDVKKIKRKNYNIILDEDVALTYYGALDNNRVVIVMYFYDGVSAKVISNLFGKEVIDKMGVEYQDNFENSRYSVSKYYDSTEKKYIYQITGKKTKVKDCYISLVYLTDLNLNEKQIANEANVLLNEAESYLRK